MALHATSFAVKSDVRIQRVAFLNEALEICKEDEHNYHAGAILHALGEVAFEFGDPVLALSYAKESAAMLVGLAPVNQAQAYINCAAYCLSIGKTDEARTAARDALAVARRIGDPMITAGAFQHFAGIATALGDADLAARLLGASNSRRAAGAATRLFTEQTGYDRTIASVREARSQEQIDHLTSEGYGWSVDLAIEQSMLV
jgi:ATP/maltotriose-dependent transcriptional regulator MalT